MELTNKDNVLMICEKQYKERLLESLYSEKIIKNITFMSLSEYKKAYFFDYGIDTIKYLMNKGLSYANCKEIVDNLYYIENKNYGIDKLDQLVAYKKELDEKGLLIYNPFFKNYLKSKNVIVAGYQKLNSFDEKIIEGKTVEFIIDKQIDKTYVINSFTDIEEEVEYVYNSISDLLKDGTDINNIYIVNAGSDYETYFKRFNTYYNFVVDYKNNSSIYGTSLAYDFIQMLEDKTREEIYDYLSSRNDDISNKLIGLLNKYVAYDLKEIKELIVNDIKDINLNRKYVNVVRCVNYNYVFNDNDYVFFIGFNDEAINLKKDTDYINGNQRTLVGLQTIEEENELIKANAKIYLSSIKNLFISYCASSAFKTFNKQILFVSNECKYVDNSLDLSHSNKLNRSKYAYKLDDLRKFNAEDNDLALMYKTYGKNDYLSYDNRFKKLTDTQVGNLITTIANKENANKLTLSYSSMDHFYKCNFRYYIEKVLNIIQREDTYYTSLGTVCHGVLQDLYTSDNFDFEESWSAQVSKIEKKNDGKIFNDDSEKHFVSMIKEELRNDIDVIKTQKENSLLDKQKCENNFTYDVNEIVRFTGFIDKVMYREKDGKLLASVVDYKTNKSITIDKNLMKYGLSLQLPSYLYLMRKADNFTCDIDFVGFYIQHLINSDRKYENDSSLQTKKAESLKLDGISSNNLDRLNAADINLNTLGYSENIKGVSLKKDGDLKANKNLCSDEELDDFVELVDEKIKDASNAILKGDFTINPKQIDGENLSCKYCPYGDICYKKDRDLIIISTDKEEQ